MRISDQLKGERFIIIQKLRAKKTRLVNYFGSDQFGRRETTMDITALNVQYEDIHEGVGPPALTVTESSPMTSEPRTLGRDSPDAVSC